MTSNGALFPAEQKDPSDIKWASSSRGKESARANGKTEVFDSGIFNNRGWPSSTEVWSAQHWLFDMFKDLQRARVRG